MNKINEVLKYILTTEYVDSHTIMYSNRLPFNLSAYEHNQLKIAKSKNLKEKDSFFSEIKLKSFNGHPLFYCSKCADFRSLVLTYTNTFLTDVKKTKSSMVIRNMPDIIKSRIYSEINGTLSIEAVSTSRKRISELINGKRKPTETNDVIIQNMARGLDFIMSTPEFNKENLFHLYHLLSEGCLEPDYQLKPGEYYRYDEVEVDRYSGCPHEKIEECMDSLFSYVNETLSSKNIMEKFLLPHIVHYYIMYIHPYFDYNGRTARMVSFWLLNLEHSFTAPIASEAIDQTKEKYYSAIRNTRDEDNDLTYFLIYILKITISYYNCYLNLEEIDSNLKNKDIVLTEIEKAYIKKIIISAKGKFIYSDFVKWIKTDMTKQGAFKLLNTLTSYGILSVSESKSKNKLFELNKDILLYRMDLLD